jgi:hypothetical protein
LLDLGLTGFAVGVAFFGARASGHGRIFSIWEVTLWGAKEVFRFAGFFLPDSKIASWVDDVAAAESAGGFWDRLR